MRVSVITYVFNNWLEPHHRVRHGFNSNVSSAGGWIDKASTNLGLRSTFHKFPNLKKNISLSGITGVETCNGRTLPRSDTPVWAGSPRYRGQLVLGQLHYWIIINAMTLKSRIPPLPPHPCSRNTGREPAQRSFHHRGYRISARETGTDDRSM